jgi:outer membrane protein assembly factor BamB
VTCEEVNLINFTTKVKIKALDLKNGHILWNRTIGEFSSINEKSLADSTPTVYNNILYAASPNGSLYAINI